MQTMGLNAVEFAAFTAQLARAAHVRTVEVTLETLDEEYVDTVTHRLLPGSQVTVDSSADVSRALELQLFDPDRTLGLDSDNPNEGALYLDRMVRVHVLVRVPAVNKTVRVPVFIGPVVTVSRADEVVSLTAHGKERLAMSPIWRALDIPAKTSKTLAVRRILAERYGETKFDLPSTDATLPKARSLGTWDVGWAAARDIADSMSRQLLYTGSGVAWLRTRPGPSQLAFTFTPDHTVGGVAVSYDGAFANAVRVVGGNKKAAHTAHAPAGHPLSAANLGRRDASGQVVPRYVAELVEDDAVGSAAAAKARAESLLNERLASQVSVSFDTTPVPHLDCGDWVAVETPNWRHEFRLEQFTIPLSAEGDPTSSVGYLKPAPVKARMSR